MAHSYATMPLCGSAKTPGQLAEIAVDEIGGVGLLKDVSRMATIAFKREGDAIVLIHGVHAIRVIEDLCAISVKQGPFLGDTKDKVDVEVQR